jgi:hypothetical protein
MRLPESASPALFQIVTPADSKPGARAFCDLWINLSNFDTLGEIYDEIIFGICGLH